MKYLTAEQVLFIHSRLIDETGGSHGIRDTSLLLSAIERPKSGFGDTELYPDIFAKSAALMESLIKNHPFIDGNKRTAITSSAIFLQVNGHNLKASQEEFERFTLKMAVEKVSLKDTAKWFREHTKNGS